ncbi:MAG: PEP-CTERM sorting domain-containing protein [Luteolibacter sp.]
MSPALRTSNWRGADTATGNSGIGFDTFASFTTHGKVIQLDGAGGGSQPQFQILFTPTATTGVYLNSFDLISGNTAAKSVSWTLSGPTSGTLASGLWTANSDIQQTITVAAGGAAGEALTLVLIGTSGPSSFLGFDNLAYDQVPEPSAAGLAILACGGWLLKRRR